MIREPSPLQPTAHRRVYDGEFGAHAHGHAQVLIALSGQLELGWGARCVRVDVSNGVVVPAGLDHDYGTRQRADILVIDTPAQPGIDRARRFAVPAGWQRRLPSLGLQGLVDEIAGRPVARARRALDLDALARHIDGDLRRAWSVRELACWAALSPQHLHERLWQDAQCTPMQFVRARRLAAARRLRASGQGPLQAIAQQVGYASASALAYALRRDHERQGRPVAARAAAH